MTMRAVLALCVVAVAAEYYETPNDRFDYSAISLPELSEHMACMLDKGPCSPMDASQRKDGPEAIRTECAKCSPDLKLTFRTFLNRAQAELPEEFAQYRLKYDPEGVHIDRLMAELNRHAGEYAGSR